MTRLFLVRHGRVENPEKVVYGVLPGWHLSETGGQEAEAAARFLADHEVTHVYTSPLERAKETAAVIAEACACPVETCPDLGEAQLCAPWQGMRWREVRTREVRGWIRYLRKPHEIRDVPEPLDALAQRMVSAIRALAARHPEGRVVAVSHGDPIKAAVLALTGGDLRHLHREPVPTGGIVILDVEGETARVRERWVPAISEAPSAPRR